MGLLEMLFGPKEPEFAERVWLTTEGKANDLTAHVRTDAERGACSMIVTHFKATQRRVIVSLDIAGVEYRAVERAAQFPSNITDIMLLKNRTVLILGSDVIPLLSTREAGSRFVNEAAVAVSVHLAEHHPLREHDRQVFALGRKLGVPMTFTCYTGLDEPWLIAFGIERIRDILLSLGLDSESALEHPLLKRSIRNAQKQMAQKVHNEQAAESCEEWVRKNLGSRPSG